MKTYMLMTGSGPIVILTSHDSVLDAALVRKLAGKGIEKFIAYEIPIGLARERYGAHFALVQGIFGRPTISVCSTMTEAARSNCFALMNSVRRSCRSRRRCARRNPCWR
jgi:hypothetical protein